MLKNMTLIAVVMTGALASSGCVPVAIGAAGAVAADTISEDRGRDLF